MCRPPTLAEVKALEREQFAAMDVAFATALTDGAEASFATAVSEHVAVQNLVWVVNLSPDVDLGRVGMGRHNMYRPQRFPSCTVRLRIYGDRQATLLLFRMGNTVCVGVRNVWEALLACHHLRLQLRSDGYATRFHDSRPVNCVTRFSVDHGVDLARMHTDRQGDTDWEPEVFPGLELKLPQYHAVVLAFDSGRCVLMGVTDDHLRRRATDHVKALLARYRDDAVPASKDRFHYRTRRRGEVMWSSNVSAKSAERMAAAQALATACDIDDPAIVVVAGAPSLHEILSDITRS